MPLVYSIDGAASTYNRDNEVPPIERIHATFKSVLSQKMQQNNRTSSEGIVPPTDSAATTALRHRLPGYEDAHSKTQHKPALVARNLMTVSLKCISQDLLVERARELMNLHGFRHLPVVAPDRKLIGILSDRDLLRTNENNSKEPVSYAYVARRSYGNA